MSDVLKDFAVKSLNLTDVQIAEILYSDAEKTTIKENAMEELLRLDSERVKALKAASKDELTFMHDKGYKKAQGETAAKFEQSLKDEFGVTESKAQGTELVKEIIAKISATTQLDDDKVKLSPLYIQLEKKLGSEYVAKADFDRINEEYNGYKSTVEKEKVLSVVISDALRAFRELKPVLPKDANKALNLEADFLGKLKAFEYEVQADGSHIIKIDGKRYENAQGHPVQFKDFIKTQADKYFEFEVQGEKGNGGNDNGGGTGSVKVPTSKEEYVIAVSNESDPLKRIAIQDAWNAKNK
jgi:hypothetical protein